MSAIAIDSKENTRVDPWRNFKKGDWVDTINVRNFIQLNYQPHTGSRDFLTASTPRTRRIWERVLILVNEEHKKQAPLDFDPNTPASITSHAPGYIDRDNELIVGLQTDEPLKRAIVPFGGIRMVQTSCETYGKPLCEDINKIFSSYRKTHNQGVFDAYTPEILKCRKVGVITGLPDAYGRGRIIGDYRRVCLYGIDRLVTEKNIEKSETDQWQMNEVTIRLREELSEQLRALDDIREMALGYGFDISKPAKNAREAVQWLYFAYLAAIKSQNGAAMSIGRIATFLDIYFERDLQAGLIDEQGVQELVDDLVIKLRMVRFLRTPEYDELFSGDPAWVTESIGGMGLGGRTLVSKTSFRMLQTLYNLGPAPEPNLTILWSHNLPQGFKDFCAEVSIDTSSIQYENDDLMRVQFGDDYGIACCVSPMPIGKQMQFFGARANLAKTLLFAINGGRDEKTNMQVAPSQPVLDDTILEYETVMERFDEYMAWLAKQYVSALNIIHFMHDKYAYEAPLMALHDRDIKRTLACGIAGLSIVADSLSAIKFAKVKTRRNAQGLVIDYDIEGKFPTYGNNDPRVDDIATTIVTRFMNHIRQNKTYRDAEPTQSILTITSNVVYGKKTGATPDGRKAGEPFAPGANPLHGRDYKGALASLLSVAKLPFEDAQDGISYTMSLVPNGLGRERSMKVSNLVGLLDGYFNAKGQHINVNVLERETLEDAMIHPEKYPQLTVRVSGYAVCFNKLTKEQQLDVIHRTFHDRL